MICLNYRSFYLRHTPGGGHGVLEAGQAYIWLCPLTETFNIDYFTIKTSATHKGANGGGPTTVPGLIEAEEIDHGGEDVAYWDTSPINIPGVG